MMQIEIVYDDQAVWNMLNDLERSQIPFATAQAMNQTMNDVQRAVRGEAYGRVFTTRNKALPKSLTMIPNKMRASKRRLKVSMVNVRDGRTGRMAGAGFINRQIKGQAKTARGSNIAIPVTGPGLRRGKGGAVPKGKRPRANPKLFKIGKRLVERQRKGLVTRYNLTPTASANRRGAFKYYETAQRTTKRVLQRRWDIAMIRAVRSTTGRYSGGSVRNRMSQ